MAKKFRSIRSIRIIRLIVGVIVIGSVLGLVYNLISKPVKASWYDDSWQYRVRITINNSGAAVANQKVKLDIATDSLVTAGKIQSTCADSRFTDLQGNLLDYYLDTAGGACNTASTDYYVLIPTINAGDTIIFHYYGNPAASSGSMAAQFSQSTFSPNLTTSATEEKGTSPVSYWNFNEGQGSSAYDGTKQANALTVTNAVWKTEDLCISGKCLYFDGNEDRAAKTYSSDTELLPSTGSFSISTWAKHSSTAGADTLIARVDAVAGVGWKLYMDSSGFICFGIDQTAGSFPVDSACTTTSYADSQWHYITGVKTTTSKITLFIDGVQKAQDVSITSTTLDGSSASFTVGNDYDNGTNGWVGFIDETKYYNYALSATQIQAGFTARNSSETAAATLGGNTQNSTLSNGLVGYWKMDSVSGQVNDNSGNSNHLVNNATATLVSGKYGYAADLESGSSQYFNSATPVSSITKIQSTYSDLEFGVNSQTVTFSSIPVDDDIIYLFYMQTAGGPASRTWPTGFTELFSGNGGGDSTYISVAWKRASSELGTTYTLNLGNSGDNNQMLVGLTYRGAYASGDPNETIGSIEHQYSSSVTVASINTLTNNAQHIIFVGSGDSQGTAAASGYALDAQGNCDPCGGAARSAILSKKITTAGATGSVSVSGLAAVAESAWNSISLKTSDGSGGPSQSLSISGSLAVSAWIRPESTTAATQFNIAGKWDSGEEGYLLSQYGDEIRMYINSSSNYVTTNTANLSTSTWYHVVGIYDSTTSSVKIYINGQEAPSTVTGTIPTSIANTDGLFHIGAANSQTTPNGFYDGRIDEVRVYNRTVTNTEISQLYNWAPSPVGYWKMDEQKWTADCSTDTVMDASGNLLHGDACPNSTGPTGGSMGKFGNGGNFDGTNDYINLYGAGSILDIVNDQVTVEAWIKADVTSGTRRIISAPGSESSGTEKYSLIINAGQLQFWINTPSVGDESVSVTYTDTTKWHHVAGVYNGVNMVIYVDGVSGDPGFGKTGDIVAITNGNAQIGRYGPTFGQYFDGLMDEVKVYNYARTAKQITQDMNAGHSSVGSPVGSSVGYWKFNEGADNTCIGGSNDVCNAGSGSTTLNGTSTATRSNSGKFNKALDFDGTNDVVTIANSTAIDFDTGLSGGVTFSGWINPDTAGEGSAGEVFRISATTFCKLGGSTPFDFSCSLDEGTDATLTVNSVIPASTWTHFALVWTNDSDDEISLYVNGILRGVSTNGVGPPFDGGANLLIGGGTSNNWDGKIDDFKVYSYELTADEIKLDYNRGSSIVMGAEDNGSKLSDGAGTAPVAYWNLDEKSGTTAYDTSSTGLTGTLTSNPAWTIGKIGSGIDFRPVNSYITVADNAVLNDTDDMTIEVWAKPAVVDGTSRIVLGKGNNIATTSRQYNLRINASNQWESFLYSGSTTYSRPNTSVTPVVDKWNHVVLLRKSDKLYTYVNGVPTSGTTLVGATNSTSNALAIGREGVNSTAYFGGFVDEVKFYDYARTDAQIAFDYNRGAPVYWYKFNECQGPTAFNSAANANGQVAGNNLTINPNTNVNTTVGSCGSGVSTEMWNDGTTGKFNSALGFDGDDDNAVSSANVGISGASARSVAAWVNITNSQYSGQQYFLGWGVDTSGNFFNLGTFQDKWYGGFNAIDFATNVTATYGTWLHHVVTYDGSTIKWYINGNLIATQLGLTLNTTDTTLYVGERSADNGYNFVGSIDDVRIYNYVLSPTQVKEIMNNSSSLYFGPATGSP